MDKASSSDLNFASDSTSHGNLDTDGYHWEGSEGSYTLTLRDITISGTVTLPDATVNIITEGDCSINALEIFGNPDKTKLTFSGGGKLSVNERISIYGGDNNAITIAKDAEVVFNGGIGIGASGGVNSVITVYGKLTVNGSGDNNAISAGQVIIGSGGVLDVSGDKGVALNGMGTGCEGAFTVERGGFFTADCTEFNIRVYTGSNPDNVINVPEDHMPDDCEVKQSGDVIMLVHKGTDNEYTGPITIHENHVWSEWKKDETSHWAECTVEGCGKKNNYGKHMFNSDTQKCECGAGLAVDLSGTEGLVYNGQAKTPDVTVTVDNQPLAAENYDTGYSKNINAGEAAVTVTGKNDLNFEQTKTFQIGKAAPAIAWSAAVQELDYTGSEAAITAPVVTLVNNETYSGTIQYSYAVQGSSEFKDGLPTGGGTYTVRARIAEQDNYTAAESGDMMLTIKCGHVNTEIRNQKKPTCTEKGYSGDTYCKDCGMLLNKGTELELDSKAHEHTEIRGQKDAACTEEGYTGDMYCKDCNTKIESGNEVPALGHDWQVSSKNGKRIYTCSRCGATRKETIRKPPKSEDKHSHSYKEGVLENASCTKAGTAVYTCDCGDTYTELIPALKHDYTHKVTTEPTIFAEGVMTYTCSRCGHRYTERIPKLVGHEHAYIAKVLKEATCTEAGIRMYICVCGDNYTESIPMLSHSYDSRVTREPTVSAEGVMTYTCSRCDDTYTRPIDKLKGTLSRAGSRPESGNAAIGEDTAAGSGVEDIREDAGNAEEQGIVASDADLAADAGVSAVEPEKLVESIGTDDADNLSQTGKQFPWWILLIAALVIITGLYVERRQKNKK